MKSTTPKILHSIFFNFFFLSKFLFIYNSYLPGFLTNSQGLPSLSNAYKCRENYPCLIKFLTAHYSKKAYKPKILSLNKTLIYYSCLLLLCSQVFLSSSIPILSNIWFLSICHWSQRVGGAKFTAYVVPAHSNSWSLVTSIKKSKCTYTTYYLCGTLAPRHAPLCLC